MCRLLGERHRRMMDEYGKGGMCRLLEDAPLMGEPARAETPVPRRRLRVQYGLAGEGRKGGLFGKGFPFPG